jgi:hypothetical protein
LRKLIGGNALKECCCYCTLSLKHTGSLHYSARNILIQLHQRAAVCTNSVGRRSCSFVQEYVQVLSEIHSGSFLNEKKFLKNEILSLSPKRNLKEFLKILILCRQ